MRSFVSLVIAFMVVFTATGCPGPDYPKCETDDQCLKDKDGNEKSEHCLFGQCQECAKDSHCKAGKSCMQGRCETTCGNDEQCGSGMICDAKKCAPVQCSNNDGCKGGTCKDGRCSKTFATGTDGAGGTGADGGADKPCERNARIQFGYNDSELPGDARTTLDQFAKCMQKNPTWKLVVEGHADERGTTDYNLQLGDARAKNIRKYIITLGVEGGRVRVVSYGEEKPIEATGNESSWARNRRGELIIQ
jgi:peptidoglycan-associated lipoprotein